MNILKNFASMYEYFNIKQVPREDNIEVDALANLSSAFKIHPDIKIPISHVTKPAIEDTKEELMPL